MRVIRWGRSEDGFAESTDGWWRIVPSYAGCTRPQDYQLWHGSKLVGSLFATQQEAKEYAEATSSMGSMKTDEGHTRPTLTRRPPEPATPAPLRAVQLGIRATAEQARAYRAAAKAAGVSLGRWMRAACDRALKG